MCIATTQRATQVLSYGPHESRLCNATIRSYNITLVKEEPDCIFTKPSERLASQRRKFIARVIAEELVGAMHIPSML